MSCINVSQYLAGDFQAETAAMERYEGRLTGFDNLDEEEFRFLPGLYVLGGTPGAGKTTWVLQLLCQLSKGTGDCAPESCVFVSYELSHQMLVCKILSRAIRIEFEKSRERKNFHPPSASAIFCGARPPEFFDMAVKECRRNLENLTIIEETSAALPIDNLINILRGKAASAGRKNFVVAIDYLQLIPSGRNDRDSAKERLDGILFKLKKFQRETNATLIVISSLNRQSNTQGGNELYSFLGSGGIEYTADVALTLSRQKPEKDSKTPPYDVKLKCSKNRYGGLFDVDFSYWAQNDYFCKSEGKSGNSTKEDKPCK